MKRVSITDVVITVITTTMKRASITAAVNTVINTTMKRASITAVVTMVITTTMKRASITAVVTMVITTTMKRVSITAAAITIIITTTMQTRSLPPGVWKLRKNLLSAILRRLWYNWILRNTASFCVQRASFPALRAVGSISTLFPVSIMCVWAVRISPASCA